MRMTCDEVRAFQRKGAAEAARVLKGRSQGRAATAERTVMAFPPKQTSYRSTMSAKVEPLTLLLWRGGASVLNFIGNGPLHKSQGPAYTLGMS